MSSWKTCKFAGPGFDKQYDLWHKRRTQSSDSGDMAQERHVKPHVDPGDARMTWGVPTGHWCAFSRGSPHVGTDWSLGWRVGTSDFGVCILTLAMWPWISQLFWSLCVNGLFKPTLKSCCKHYKYYAKHSAWYLGSCRRSLNKEYVVPLLSSPLFLGFF